MAEYFEVHPESPQPRRIRQAVEIVRKGGVIAYPTDSSYALGCHIGDKKAMDRIRRIRRVDDKHNFTLVCRDLSELSLYAKVDNSTYRLLKANTPGSYTFILEASKEVPRRLQNPKRKTIGLRVPDHPVALALLEELGEPLMSSTLILPGEEQPESIAWEIKEKLDHTLDAILDGGWCGIEPTTVVDLTSGEPVVVRKGLGDTTPFE
ncbi:MAG: threonylcarbamoyl-AMP synthase [Gammaproteobacteria bacterium]|nr:MAG: threonylcarbamoyl-AMP synthase [Gammaproteobacteria bacterium]RTZ59722.1 MAG: threonylcarbamoyl-AMP synthase [Gammaproteobacteria bacterium]